ncbi:hypothetical protein NW813_09995 [Synechococcus sp. R55.6]|jgi:hypothetical protein|uniref:hypothetical protein n=1 Tax=unclassified Synechococcus TaxID=2626047 RepID=UPI0039C00DFE
MRKLLCSCGRIAWGAALAATLPVAAVPAYPQPVLPLLPVPSEGGAARGGVVALFNQSIWWDFIRGNRGENLRLFPASLTSPSRQDVVAVFQIQRQPTVEPVVRVLSFEHQGGYSFRLLHTAEPIPGRLVEAHLRTDITSSPQPKLVLLTERGGISLLRSVLVLEHRPEGLVPLLSVTDLSNASLRVSPQGILVISSPPGASRDLRATLYQWEGDGFVRRDL